MATHEWNVLLLTAVLGLALAWAMLAARRGRPAAPAPAPAPERFRPYRWHRLPDGRWTWDWETRRGGIEHGPFFSRNHALEVMDSRWVIGTERWTPAELSGTFSDVMCYYPRWEARPDAEQVRRAAEVHARLDQAEAGLIGWDEVFRDEEDLATSVKVALTWLDDDGNFRTAFLPEGEAEAGGAG